MQLQGERINSVDPFFGFAGNPNNQFFDGLRDRQLFGNDQDARAGLV